MRSTDPAGRVLSFIIFRERAASWCDRWSRSSSLLPGVYTNPHSEQVVEKKFFCPTSRNICTSLLSCPPDFFALRVFSLLFLLTLGRKDDKHSPEVLSPSWMLHDTDLCLFRRLKVVVSAMSFRSFQGESFTWTLRHSTCTFVTIILQIVWNGDPTRFHVCV